MAKSKRELQEINAGSMADIAFLLLIFFLVTTTMQIDTGLQRMLPPPLPPTEEPPDVKERNILQVKINRNNQLLVNKRFMKVDKLRETTIEFLKNENNNPKLPVFKTVNIPLLGDVPVTKGIISVQNDRKTNYGTYIDVQNELIAAYNIVRNESAQKFFGMSFDKLTEAQKDAIKELWPQKISEAEPRDMTKK